GDCHCSAWFRPGGGTLSGRLAADRDQLWQASVRLRQPCRVMATLSPHHDPDTDALPAILMKKVIAIIEDEPALRENYSAAFQRHGYAVRAYGARHEAIVACRERLPDLAVIDVGLKDEPDGGFELCRELRAMSAELPIIFLTARDSELDAVSGLRLGADDYLTKDLSLTHLLARVTAL